MSKSCPTCRRTGTLQFAGSNTCFGCNPPAFSLYELVPIDGFGTQFFVEKRFFEEMRSFLDCEMDSSGLGRKVKPLASIFDKQVTIKPKRTVRMVCKKYDTGLVATMPSLPRNTPWKTF